MWRVSILSHRCGNKGAPVPGSGACRVGDTHPTSLPFAPCPYILLIGKKTLLSSFSASPLSLEIFFFFSSCPGKKKTPSSVGPLTVLFFFQKKGSRLLYLVFIRIVPFLSTPFVINNRWSSLALFRLLCSGMRHASTRFFFIFVSGFITFCLFFSFHFFYSSSGAYYQFLGFFFFKSFEFRLMNVSEIFYFLAIPEGFLILKVTIDFTAVASFIRFIRKFSRCFPSTVRMSTMTSVIFHLRFPFKFEALLFSLISLVIIK